MQNFKEDTICKELEEKTAYLHMGLNDVLTAWAEPFRINRLGSMISIHFSDYPVTDFASAAAANNLLFNKYFHAMLLRGICLPSSAFESWFLNNALSYPDLDETIAATKFSLADLHS